MDEEADGRYGNSEDEDIAKLPAGIVGNVDPHFDVDSDEKGPDQRGGQGKEPFFFAPDVIERKEEDEGSGNCPDKGHPAAPSSFHDEIAHEEDGRQCPNRQDSQEGDDDPVGYDFPWIVPPDFPEGRLALGVGQEIECHSVEVSQFEKGVEVGESLAAFPFGDGFVAIGKAFGQLSLSQTSMFSQEGEVSPDRRCQINHLANKDNSFGTGKRKVQNEKSRPEGRPWLLDS